MSWHIINKTSRWRYLIANKLSKQHQWYHSEYKMFFSLERMGLVKMSIAVSLD